MTRAQQKTGKQGQGVAEAALRRIGVLMVEPIGTPIRMIPSGRNDGTYRVIFGEKVSGDHRGVGPQGISVLVETKTILNGNLKWSDFREHQPERLDYHNEIMGISLVVWVHSSGVYIMVWPIEGFAPRKSITPQYAAEISIESI